jgi:2-phospho-L-lactate guanylyltransferase
VTVWAVIPIKASPASKSRLSGALDADARAELVGAMLGHVVGAAREATKIARVCLVGNAPGMPDDVTILPDAGEGLNAAVQSALSETARQGASRVVFVHGDLPLVTARDFDLLAAAPAGTIALAPDRHGTGTNAISLPLPEAADFAFAFGPDSLARHRNEAERLYLRLEEIHSQGLARDIDEPADLPDADGLMTGLQGKGTE